MAKMYNSAGRSSHHFFEKSARRGGKLSVAETQILLELLNVIHDLTGARAAVCGSGMGVLAACPADTDWTASEQLQVPIVREGAEVGYILLETTAQNGEVIEKDRLNSAVKLIDVMLASMGFTDLLMPQKRPLQQTILDYIEKNLSEDLSVQTLCHSFSVSKSELYRLLREQAPHGVAAYVRQKRFQKACDLLRHTGKPLWQIAEEVGYDDSDYFLRAFKKEMGVSAGKYRKNNM